MPPVHAKKPCSDCMFADGGKCEKHMPKMADGGEMDMEPAGPADDEAGLGDMLGEELANAIEHKDHKAIVQSIEAIVENCLSKKGDM